MFYGQLHHSLEDKTKYISRNNCSIGNFIIIQKIKLNIFLEINVLWAAHQVHHSSEDYNLSTALRQSAFQAFGAWVRFTNHHPIKYIKQKVFCLKLKIPKMLV